MKYQTLNNRFEPIQVRKQRGTNVVPDMSFTPREIISKFSRGEKVPLGFMGRFDSEDSPDDPKFSGYDPAIFEDDPTRDPAFDFGDYVEEQHELKERQRAKKAADRKKASDAKRKANEEKSSASGEPTSEPKSEAPAPTSGE